MSHTNNRMQRHWAETKTFIKATWPKITDVELNRINGDFDQLAVYLKEFYNDVPRTEAAARDKLQRFLNGMDAKHPERTVGAE